MQIEERCQRVKLILSDVDGVLTNGGLWFDNQGNELKQFHIRDGMAIRLWQRAGYHFGLVTGRVSNIVKARAAELNIQLVRQGSEDKWPVVQEVLTTLGLTPAETCYIGDDLPDLPVIVRVGFGVTVADAAPELRMKAHYITRSAGGCGAVRELVEILLKAQSRWEGIVEHYL